MRTAVIEEWRWLGLGLRPKYTFVMVMLVLLRKVQLVCSSGLERAVLVRLRHTWEFRVIEECRCFGLGLRPKYTFVMEMLLGVAPNPWPGAGLTRIKVDVNIKYKTPAHLHNYPYLWVYSRTTDQACLLSIQLRRPTTYATTPPRTPHQLDWPGWFQRKREDDGRPRATLSFTLGFNLGCIQYIHMCVCLYVYIYIYACVYIINRYTYICIYIHT